MKLSLVLVHLLASLTLGAPTVLSSEAAEQPACVYPIGASGGNAKVAGRLFDIDGKVQYFAGN